MPKRPSPDTPSRSPLRTHTSRPATRQNHALRKITSQAGNSMRTRTAREQLAEALAAGQAPDDLPLPDADDASVAGVLR